MPPSLKSVIFHPVVVFICLCVESGNFQNQTLQSNVSEVSRIEVDRYPNKMLESTFNSLNSSFTNFHVDNDVKNSSLSNISNTKPVVNDHEIRKTTATSIELTEFAMEGGGIGVPSQNTSVKSQDDGAFDEFHNKGSKGRKGVKFPGSSVVPRKGVSAAVDQLSSLLVLDDERPTTKMETFTVKSPASNNTKSAIDSKFSLSINHELTKPKVKVQMQETPSVNLNITHSKKPEYVSDEKDIDDFDKYSIIKTSTTGQDYVIIGIVIVIGIWFSVFGALIFYRRAGEYWDRRHYRRMDFLVEGMYND